MGPFYEDYECPERKPPDEEIVGISISDDDFVGWYKALKSGGFADEEIEPILRHLNKKYDIDCRIAVTIKIEKADDK